MVCNNSFNHCTVNNNICNNNIHRGSLTTVIKIIIFRQFNVNVYNNHFLASIHKCL